MELFEYSSIPVTTFLFINPGELSNLGKIEINALKSLFSKDNDVFGKGKIKMVF